MKGRVPLGSVGVWRAVTDDNLTMLSKCNTSLKEKLLVHEVTTLKCLPLCVQENPCGRLCFSNQRRRDQW